MLLLALIAFGVPLALSLRDRVDSEVKGQARSQAEVVATSAAEFVDPPQPPPLQRIVDQSADSVRGRVIVVDSRGSLVADSAGAPRGRSYADRPEVKAALGGERQQITRSSETLGTQILATAVPVYEHHRVSGAVRITQSVDAVNRAIKTSVLDVAALAGVVLALGMIAGGLIAQQIARPIRRLDRAARSVAAGDLDSTVTVEGSSEQRSLARTFNEMTQRVRRLLRAQQDFVADASHQLRTPLTGLRLRLEGLGERLRGEPRASAEIEAAMTEIDRLALIVDELLILSRAGERELPGGPIDLPDAAGRAVERWRHTAAERNIELELRNQPGRSQGWCAGPDLDRAVDSLIENALRYSPRGSTVTVAGGNGAIAVLDRGPGLAPGEEETVFERFSRGSAGQGGPAGTGLGLAIARELTRRWGGDVVLGNREGGGLRATVELSPAEVVK
ncbi:MAG TPA: ATP-binding protein [Solirubrobacterales bacterium]|nr:ATP-binding protein [Solirubrobacterales bacterium]